MCVGISLDTRRKEASQLRRQSALFTSFLVFRPPLIVHPSPLPIALTKPPRCKKAGTGQRTHQIPHCESPQK